MPNDQEALASTEVEAPIGPDESLLVGAALDKATRGEVN